MNKFYLSLICLLLPVLSLKGQISVTATAGTASGTYINLTTAFEAINSGEHQGIITVLVNASCTEPATARLNASKGLSNYTSIRIMPTAVCTITGNVRGALIDLNGADSVIIDGRINGAGTERSLTIQNLYATSYTRISTIRFINGASRNIIRYVKVKGAGQGDMVGNIYIADTDNSEVNSYNIIDNNDVGATETARPAVGIAAYNGSSTPANQSNAITNNLIHDFHNDSYTRGYGIYVYDNNNYYTITGNSVYQTSPVISNSPSGDTYIAVEYGDGHVISNNFLGGSEPFAGGAPATYIGQAGAGGISVGAHGFTTPIEIDGNIIGNFSFTNTDPNLNWMTAFGGIFTAYGNYKVGLKKGNIIGSLTKNGAITVTYAGANNSVSLVGITSSGSSINGSTDVQNNQIGSFTINGTAAGKASIIGIACYDLTRLNLQNNVVGGPSSGSFQITASTGSIVGVSLYHQINTAEYICRQNTIQNFSLNTDGTLNATITGISSTLYPAADNTVANIISDNQITNLHTVAPSAANGSVKGVYINVYSTANNSFINNTITKNQISYLKSESPGISTVVMGIDNECPFNRFLNVDSNIIHHLSSTAANVKTYSLASVQGIRSIEPGDAPVNIIGNNIYDIESTSAAATWVAGISGFHTSNSNAFTVSGNRIYNLKNDHSQEGSVVGVDVKGAGATGKFDIINNMISLKPDNVKVYGIINSGSASNLRLYYNSVVITGSAINNNASGAFCRTSAAGTSIVSVDNIFYNTRSGGAGNHYALVNENVTPVAGWEHSNFNDLYSSNAATTALWGNTALSFSDYKQASNQDSCSKSTIVDFSDINNGDLHLLNTNNNKTLTGVAVTGITTDIDGDPRHVNPSIGADEIETYLGAATVTAAGPTTFCEGGSVTLSSSLTSGNQWYRDGVLIAGATSQTYQAEDNGVYYVIFADGCITASTDSVHVIVHPIPAKPSIVREGDVLQSSASTDNQWFLDGNIIPGATDQQITATQAGIYTVVTGVDGCIATSDPYDFTPCTSLILNNTVSNILCAGTATGMVQVTVNGDESLLTYAWSNGAQTKDLVNVVAGSYKLVVSNEVGCKDSVDITVTEPAALLVSETHHDINCKEYKRGSIDLTVSGGTAPYRYEWSNGAVTEDLTNLPGGQYSAVVYDANNCSKEIAVTIERACGPEESANLYPNPASNSLNVDMNGYTGELSLAIYDLMGNQKLDKIMNIETGIIQIDIQQLPAGDYVLKIKTSNGIIKKRFKKINI